MEQMNQIKTTKFNGNQKSLSFYSVQMKVRAKTFNDEIYSFHLDQFHATQK